MSLKLTYFNGTINEIGFSTENFSTVLYGNKYHHQFPVGYVPSSVSSLYDGFRFVNHTGRLDNTRKYSIHDFVWVGNQWSTLTDQNVCLATQTSVDLLFWLITVAHHWHGPISVSVFVPDHDYYIAIHYIHHVRRCFPVIRDNVSFHFVYPIKRPPKFLSKLTNGTSLSCSEIHRFNSIMNWQPDTAQSWKKTLLYPQNHMRNVARKGCQTPYVFLTDIDIIPRMGLCSLLHQFLQHPPCERCVFVIPTYEVDNDIALPPNKTMLVELVRRKKAQPFHNAVFINNQFATNASKWENLPEEVGLNFVYPVTNFELYYEPFYVSKDDVPPHDERFVGYGYTRNTQVNTSLVDSSV